MKSRLALLAALMLGQVAQPAFAQQGDGTNVQYPVTVFKPNKVPATSERIAQLKAPEGFTVEAFASGLGNARIARGSDRFGRARPPDDHGDQTAR